MCWCFPRCQVCRTFCWMPVYLVPLGCSLPRMCTCVFSGAIRLAVFMPDSRVQFLLWSALIFGFALVLLRRHASGLFFSQDSTFPLRSRFYPVPVDFRTGVRVTIDWTRVHIVRPVFALLVFEQSSHSLGARWG